MNRKIQEEQIITIINLYKSGISTIDLGKMFNIHNSTIGNILKKSNIFLRKPTEFNRKTSLNHDYFSIVDSEEKAYWLG
jgi:intein-encoded DNA endonuclease-like protein